MHLSIGRRAAAGRCARPLPKPGLRAALGWGMLALCLTAPAPAQAPSADRPAAQTSSKSEHAKRPRPRHKLRKRKTTEPAAAAVTPAEPPAPQWPINEKPNPAKVTWDSHGLTIEAVNSSLMQIMEDVSTATGTKVAGLDRDERVFGKYGPGPARDVLSQLLQGSGYNIMMLGSESSPKQMEILLTPRTGGTNVTYPAPSAAANNAAAEEPNEPEPEEPPQPPPPTTPNTAPPGMGAPNAPARTPQQIMQQIRERQMQSPPEQNAPPQ